VEEAGRYTHQAHLEIHHPSAEAGRPDVRSSLQLIGNDSMNLGITQRIVRVEENLKRFTLLSLEKRREKWEKKKRRKSRAEREPSVPLIPCSWRKPRPAGNDIMHLLVLAHIFSSIQL
jgi:hypothetical protein